MRNDLYFEKREKLVPPGNSSRFTGMHWLQQIWEGSAGYPPYVALQWNAASKTWTHSNEQDVYGAKVLDVNTSNHRYIKPIPLPEIGE